MKRSQREKSKHTIFLHFYFLINTVKVQLTAVKEPMIYWVFTSI